MACFNIAQAHRLRMIASIVLKMFIIIKCAFNQTNYEKFERGSKGGQVM